MKFDELLAFPYGVVTEIGPEVAADGTVVLMLVVEAEVTVASEPLNATLLLVRTVWKLVPAIVTAAPAAPWEGWKLVIVGAGPELVTVKEVLLVAGPSKLPWSRHEYHAGRSSGRNRGCKSCRSGSGDYCCHAVERYRILRGSRAET